VILKTFQSSQPLVLLLLPIIMMFFWFSGFANPQLVTIDHTSYLFKLIEPVNPYLNKILAFVIIILTGVSLNSMINSTDFFDKNTYLPALLYVVFMSGVPQFQQLHPIVISNLFWVLAYRRFLKVYGQVSCKSEIFDASLFILIGAAFNYPSGVFLILLPWTVLIIFRPFVLNEYLMPLFALLLVSLYIFVSQFIFKINLFDIREIIDFESESTIDIKMNWTHYVLYSILAILFVLSFYHIRQKLSRSTIRYRKLINTLGMFVLIVVGVILIEHWYFTNDSVILFAAVPLTVMFTFYFFYSKHRWASFLIFYAIVALKLVNIYLL
jgi:hypothetical protein